MSRKLAQQILADPYLQIVLERARDLLKTGLTAGSGYGEVWIRDLNTFIELSLQVNPPEEIRTALLAFFRFQLANGDVPDGFIPKERGSVSYKYRRSELAPGLLAHKNTVETDQETSLVQAVRRYVAVTQDRAFLQEQVAGKTVLDRLELALEYLPNERVDSKHGLICGATTADWGDVQPEHEWGSNSMPPHIERSTSTTTRCSSSPSVIFSSCSTPLRSKLRAGRKSATKRSKTSANIFGTNPAENSFRTFTSTNRHFRKISTKAPFTITVAQPWQSRLASFPTKKCPGS